MSSANCAWGYKTAATTTTILWLFFQNNPSELVPENDQAAEWPTIITIPQSKAAADYLLHRPGRRHYHLAVKHCNARKQVGRSLDTYYTGLDADTTT